MAILLADSGATKCEWCLISSKKQLTVFTLGINPYFLDASQIASLIKAELLPALTKARINEIHFYGTGLSNPNNVGIIRKALKQVFPATTVEVYPDIMATARASCGTSKGIACILGTGSNCCYFNGKRILKISPGLGYVLGDEGSGAYLGRKVIQYYLYNTFDEDLRYKFDAKFVTNRIEILENTYKKPLPNRYLAGFAVFLAENRGHYMIENIIEDGLNDFFFQHLCKFNESWKYPIHFVGGVAFGFKDVLQDLCKSYEFDLGKILKNPMEGLVDYHG
ncbi:MAG TPA: N-acetylglucosamine kinase [Chitinophagaceae bacterium]|nr:N-acetylglucosamine kinase [Chitinophagaceae bacterium]